eukprot:SAG25_NODE_162_length_13200_cov_4.969163_5_plen_169_part_00
MWSTTLAAQRCAARTQLEAGNTRPGATALLCASAGVAPRAARARLHAPRCRRCRRRRRATRAEHTGAFALGVGPPPSRRPSRPSGPSVRTAGNVPLYQTKRTAVPDSRLLVHRAVQSTVLLASTRSSRSMYTESFLQAVSRLGDPAEPLRGCGAYGAVRCVRTVYFKI